MRVFPLILADILREAFVDSFAKAIHLPKHPTAALDNPLDLPKVNLPLSRIVLLMGEGGDFLGHSLNTTEAGEMPATVRHRYRPAA